MDYEARIPLQDFPKEGKHPPEWAVGDHGSNRFWYFENEHGEQWAARKVGNELVLAGSDIGWAELRLTAERGKREFARIAQYLSTGKAPPMELSAEDDVPADIKAEVAATQSLGVAPFNAFTLGRWIVNDAEAIWIASVILSAFRFELSRMAQP